MGVFSHFRKHKVSGEVAPETNRTTIRDLVPQDRREEVIKAALDGAGITMSAGELREAVIDACSALIVKRLYLGDSDEHGLAQTVIDSRTADLGRDRQALEIAEGDPEAAARINLHRIGEAIDQAPGLNGENHQGAQNSTSQAGHSTEPPLAAA